MPAAVALSNSPVFSPSHRHSPSFCTPSMNLNVSFQTPSTPPLSPLGFRLQKSQSPPQSQSQSPVCKSPKSLILKRKRPLRIEIPAAPAIVPAGEKFVAAERVDEVEIEGEEYAVYCKRGRRGQMEDRYSAVVGLEGDSKQAFFGVFDGHGGNKAAEFASKNMEKHVMDEVRKESGEGIEEAVKKGYLATDAAFLKEENGGGACCATALIRNGELVVSNAGDCRVVMSRGGVAEALTVDHRPSRNDEKERIEKLGGYVDFCHGVWRIQGSLAVSRGIGDRTLKQWVISEPETKVLSIKPDCEFLILASDGLWDKVNNQEAVDVVRDFCVGNDKRDTFAACRKLAQLSATRGSTDDISVMVIPLPHFSLPVRS